MPTLPTLAAAPTADELLPGSIVLFLALALVPLLPFAFMTVTAFAKIATVLQIVRSAIGAQGVPSNAVIMALAGALTLIAMAPVGEKIASRAPAIFSGGRSTADAATWVQEGFEAVREPMRQFLIANASQVERKRFLEIAQSARSQSKGASVGADDMTVVIPAFIVTELGEAFAIGFLIYLPFLVIDLVVSNVLLALGMQMLNPTQISLPFKLLLFVAIDGWGLLARALVSGYHAGAG
jgi:type III secretion protein R